MSLRRVTGGVGEAVAKAQELAGDRDVTVSAGAQGDRVTHLRFPVSR